MCVNDQTALGVMIGLKARGYDIPRDFSVTGFDDVPQASFMTPSLTTIRQPRVDMGESAAETLLGIVKAPADADQPETVKLWPAELIERESVRSI